MPNYESVNMISGKVCGSLKMVDDGRRSRRSFQSFIVLLWSSGASELQTPASVESALPLVQSPYSPQLCQLSLNSDNENIIVITSQMYAA